jgi:hypothetical protein
MSETIDYGAIARKLIEQVATMRAEVPFLTDRRQADLRKLTNAARVPDDFIEHLKGVIATSTMLTSTIQDDVNGMLDQRRYSVAFALVEAQLRAFADSIHATMLALRHESGLRALDAYAAIQGLLRQPGGQDLVPHVRNLRTILVRKRSRGVTEPEPTPTPAPDPNPTPTA